MKLKSADSYLSLLVGVACLAAAMGQLAYVAHSQPSAILKDNFWQTDGSVRALLVTNGAVYIGGQFGYIGPNTGGAGVIDSNNALPKRAFPRIDGNVFAAAADGEGGWYLGGAFTNVGGVVRTNLARVRSDNSVDAEWMPSPNGICATLVRMGETIFAGGNFTAISGQTRNGIAALDATTANAGSWNPNANGVVLTIAVAEDRVYAGGNFTEIGGQARNRLAAIDTATGLATGWDPDAGDENAVVSTIALAGKTLYVGGTFTSIGTKPRNRIAALDTTTAIATSWNPNASAMVNALAVAGHTIFVGGQFSSIAGQMRSRIAALDESTGRALEWNPSANGNVNFLLATNNTVYAGGNFTQIGGSSRYLVAALDAGTGDASPWNPSFSSFSPTVTLGVFSLALSGSDIFVGGTFSSIGGMLRKNLASLDVATGEANSWNPASGGVVNTLTFYSNHVYVAGSFTNVGGQARNSLAALDALNGIATDWHPDATGSGDSSVFALAFSSNRVYVGGNFTNIGGRPRNSLAAVDLVTGTATAFNPSPGLSNGLPATITSLLLSGDLLYVGGEFTRIGSQARSRLAALSITTGIVSEWNPGADDLVSTLLLVRSNIYAGGRFTTIGGQLRNRIAAVDRDTGMPTLWNPDAGGSSPIILALGNSGNQIYAGGQFTSIGGEFRNRSASLQIESSQASAWNPDANAPVRALAVTGDAIYLGGDFTNLEGKPHTFLAAYSTQPFFILGSLRYSAEGRFSFGFSANVGQQLLIQASPDLIEWTGIDTNTPTSTPLTFTDQGAPAFTRRFYRLLQQTQLEP